MKEPKKKPPPMVVVTAKVTEAQKVKFRQIGGKRFREWIDRAKV